MNELIVLLGAEIDIQAIYTRLEEFGGRLGSHFVESVELSFDDLRAFPELGPVFARSIRRLVMRKSSYGIFYSIVGRRILVHAVMSLRMSKQSISRKLWDDS